MHDIKKIKENPLIFEKLIKSRGEDINTSLVLELDDKRRDIQHKLHENQNNRNVISKEIGFAIKNNNNDEAIKLKQQVLKFKENIFQLEKDEKNLLKKINEILSNIPNLPFSDVPYGTSEEENLEIRKWGSLPIFDFNIKDHVELGQNLGLMDFDKTSEISGSRFVTLKGQLAKLERALGSFMLDIHTKFNNYTEVSPPLLVKEQSPFGVGQLPKFKDDLFQTSTGHWLISTGEVPLTNLHRDEIIDINKLPIRYVAHTPCFRSEAGAAGKDTRGMLRMHQFYKVEIVSFVTPDNGKNEHERLTNCAEDILKKLDLPYRVVNLCTGDLGFSSQKTYDLEVWIPSQKKYREISSCSYFGDFQARRMNTRFMDLNKKYQYVHTLNGSGLAIGRTLVSILENYQNVDGSIQIPDILKPYMGGIKKIDSE